MKAVLHRTMDWRGILVLSFLFASEFIYCQNGTHYEESYGHHDVYGSLATDGRAAETNQPRPPEPDTSHDNGRNNLQNYNVGEATSRQLSDVGRHTCVESNDEYDCIFRHVFINESSPRQNFGSSNYMFNNQTKLKFLDSSIRTLPRALLDTFTNVKLLNLEHLQIEKIESGALVNGRKIEKLYLGYNNIVSLDRGVFDNLVALELLALDGNNLASIPNGLFNRAKNLQVIFLENNKLNRIDDNTFIQNTKLENINVTNNQLVHFSLSRIPSLFFVDVSHNKLEKLEVPSLCEELYASHNEIKEVIGIGPNFNKLTKLVLSYNNLSTTEWVQRFTKVTDLDLSHNEIEDITSNDFKYMSRLTHLYLNNNRLFKFDIQNKEVMKSLKVLDLSHNELIYVESNYRQFQTLEELYLNNNKIVSLKIETPSKQNLNTMWSLLKKLTLANNDWDCELMTKFLVTFPHSPVIDYGVETYCINNTLPQGLCCTRVEMAYHNRLIKKIAEVTSYEKVARANGRCNAGQLTNSVQNVSTIVTQPGALPSSDLARELQTLKMKVQSNQQKVSQKEIEVTQNINKIDTLTRFYRVTKTGLVLPSETLGKVFGHLKQRDEFKINETIARESDAEGKKNELLLIKTENERLQSVIDSTRSQTKSKSVAIGQAIKDIKKLEKEINKNVKAVHSGK